MGRTGTDARPLSARISRAKSYHEHTPSLLICTVPRASLPTRPRIAAARSRVYVGEPIWSLTTESSGLLSAALSIFSGNDGPCTPKSQEVRPMHHSEQLLRSASSPAALE